MLSHSVWFELDRSKQMNIRHQTDIVNEMGCETTNKNCSIVSSLQRPPRHAEHTLTSSNDNIRNGTEKKKTMKWNLSQLKNRKKSVEEEEGEQEKQRGKHCTAIWLDFDVIMRQIYDTLSVGNCWADSSNVVVSFLFPLLPRCVLHRTRSFSRRLPTQRQSDSFHWRCVRWKTVDRQPNAMTLLCDDVGFSAISIMAISNCIIVVTVPIRLHLRRCERLRCDDNFQPSFDSFVRWTCMRATCQLSWPLRRIAKLRCLSPWTWLFIW